MTFIILHVSVTSCINHLKTEHSSYDFKNFIRLLGSLPFAVHFCDEIMEKEQCYKRLSQESMWWYYHSSKFGFQTFSKCLYVLFVQFQFHKELPVKTKKTFSIMIWGALSRFQCLFATLLLFFTFASTAECSPAVLPHLP